MSDFINFQEFNQKLRLVSNKSSFFKVNGIAADVNAVLSRLGSLASTYAINYVTVRMMSDDPQTGTKDSTSPAGIQLARNCIDRAVSDVSGYMEEADELASQLAEKLPSSWEVEYDLLLALENCTVNDGVISMNEILYTKTYAGTSNDYGFAFDGSAIVQGDTDVLYMFCRSGDPFHATNKRTIRFEDDGGIWYPTSIRSGEYVKIDTADLPTFEPYTIGSVQVSDIVSAKAAFDLMPESPQYSKYAIGVTNVITNMLFVGLYDVWAPVAIDSASAEIRRLYYMKTPDVVMPWLPRFNSVDSVINVVKKPPVQIVKDLLYPSGLRELIISLDQL